MLSSDHNSATVQSAAKKSIITVALTFLQRLEFPIEMPVTSESETAQSEAIKEDRFIKDCKSQYAHDCSVIYEARVQAAQHQGVSKELIPQLVVPLVLDPDDKQYQVEVPVQVKNEQGHLNGRFGWCLVCRKPADYYCKDTRVPVCSSDCKLRYLEVDNHCQRRNLEVRVLGEAKKKQLVADCLMMFNTFMQYAFNETK